MINIHDFAESMDNFEGGSRLMFSYSAAVREDDVYNGYADNRNTYSINCSGYIKILRNDVRMYRTRKDYYLVYIINGMGHFMTSGKKERVPAGNIVIYRPGEQQEYYYYCRENPEFYWVHFTGTNVCSLLGNLCFSDRNFYSVGINTYLVRLFKKMIYEIQIKKPLYENISVACLVQLLLEMSRSHRYRDESENRFDNVIEKMYSEYNNQHGVDFYAELSNLSTCQFIREFKSVTSMTPMKYIEQIRMVQARELLSGTDLAIGEIARMTGYKDQFYFSRVFKKNIGLSPRNFRNIT